MAKNGNSHTPGARTLATLTAGELETSTGWFEKLCFSGKRAELPGNDSPRLLEKASSGLVGGGDGGRRSGENGIGSVRTGGVPGENVIDLQRPYKTSQPDDLLDKKKVFRAYQKDRRTSMGQAMGQEQVD